MVQWEQVITSLDISGAILRNSVGDAGATALAEALKGNTTLTSLVPFAFAPT